MFDIGLVGAERGAAHAFRLDRIHDGERLFFGCHAANRHIGPLFRQCERRGRADPARTARDERDFSFEGLFHVRSCFLTALRGPI